MVQSQAIDIQGLRALVLENDIARMKRANAELAKLIAESQKLLASTKH